MNNQLVKNRAKNLYEEDFYLWLETTYNQIRKQEFNQVDWENLLEEIESLGKEQKHKIESYLKQLFKHLLLYQYWEEEKTYCARGWAEEIDNFRGELEILVRSKTLHNYLISVFDLVYQKARRAAIIKSDLKNLPTECPYTVEQVLDADWFPE